MAQEIVSQLPIENFYLSNTQVAILIMGLIEFLLLHFFIDTKRICSFFSGSRPDSILSRKVEKKVSCHHDSKPSMSRGEEQKRDDQSAALISREDTEIVLKSLGISQGLEEAKHSMKIDVDSISNMFEEENISMDEVKQVFDIFDKNRDGFIDAEELQSILCNLGFNEGVELKNCWRMIEVFDENDDGRIDFDEFVKFIEHSLS